MENHLKKSSTIMFINNKGVGFLPFMIIISIAFLIGQQFVLIEQQRIFEEQLRIQNYESQVFFINNLTDVINSSVAVRNSRLSTNTSLYQCLTANPSPCDETVTYDMQLYSPNPPLTLTTSTWPTPPNGLPKLAGGRSANKVLLNKSGGKCPDSITEPNLACPLQAIIQFKPMCGGTAQTPAFQSTPGPCPGKATGFQITVGVGVFKRNQFVYDGRGIPKSDSTNLQISAVDIMN